MREQAEASLEVRKVIALKKRTAKVRVARGHQVGDAEGRSVWSELMGEREREGVQGSSGRDEPEDPQHMSD